MDKRLLHVRAMLANHAVSELYSRTRKLYEKYGYDGAKDYLQTQLNFLRDMCEVDEMSEEDLDGDENGF